MVKEAEVTAYQPQEMYAFAATVDDEGQRHLLNHLSAMGLESVGAFEATGCTVFEDRMRHVGRYVSGTVFQVGHGATQNITPRMIYNPLIDPPEGWQ